MRSPNEQYVETVAVALHGKYGGAGTPSWTRVKEEVREEWLRDARELLDEIRPDLRYITARGQDHHELSEALGIDPGLLEWHRLIETVRELRAAGSRPTEEFARMRATSDIVCAVLRLLSAEYAGPHAHSDADSEYAEDMLLDAARRLVAARAGEDAGTGETAGASRNTRFIVGELAEPTVAEDVDDLQGLLSTESIQEGIAYGHPALYPLSVKTGRIVPKDDESEA